jgi:hypothetical protein
VKTFVEQVGELRENSQSVSSLSSEINKYITEKYSPRGKGGFEDFKSFLSGKIYFAEYSTPTKLSDSVKYINRYPMFLFISEEKIGNETICKVIDLNVIPPDFRGEILTKIFDFYFQKISENSKTPNANQQSLNLDGKSLQILLEGTGYKTSVTGFKRQYLSNVKVVDYTDWVRIPYISISSIQGLPIEQIYTSYRSKLKD